MPIDPSIPLGVRRVQLDKPQDIRLKSLALQGAERENATAMRAEQERKTLADLYRTTGGDPAAFEKGLADAGLGAQIPAFQKQRAELGKADTDAQASKLKLAKDKLDAVNGAFSSLLAIPQQQLTTQNAIQTLNQLVGMGVYTPEQGAQLARDLPGDPVRLRQFIMQNALQGAEASKRLELMLPKYNEQNRGGTINEGTIDPMTGQRTAGPDVQKTLTPGDVQQAENVRTMAGAGVTYQTDANGNFVALPTKPGAGPINPRAVTNNDGSPTLAKGLNDAQSKALLFGSRARDAAAIMAELEAAGTFTPSIVKQAVAKTPVVGGLLEMGANKVTASAPEQKLEQAQRDFVNAVLRRESGAVISESEFENARRQYFPAIGDTPDVIQQKAQARQIAIQGLLAEVPEAARNSIGNPTGNTPRNGPRPPLNAFDRKAP